MWNVAALLSTSHLQPTLRAIAEWIRRRTTKRGSVGSNLTIGSIESSPGSIESSSNSDDLKSVLISAGKQL